MRRVTWHQKYLQQNVLKLWWLKQGMSCCFLPCYLLTHTCHPQLCVHMPPGSPFACPSVLQGLGWGIWLVLWKVKIKIKNFNDLQYLNITQVSTDVSAQLDSQFVHQVSAQVLSDMFMPGLPHACSRKRGGSGQVSDSSNYWPVWH